MKRRRRVNIAKLTKVSFLPSVFTLFSLFLGYLALMQIIKGNANNFVNACYLLTGSVVLDGFDGTVARLTKTESNFGVQLDSLVDAVTFGMVPAVMIYIWGFKAGYPQIGKVIGFIYLSAGVIRLARFNVLKDAKAFPENVFVGLPIPLGALSICSVVMIVMEPLGRPTDVLAFALFVILIAFLMISNIKYRTMKKLKSKNNLVILLMLAIGVAFAINFPQYTIPAISLIYMISPVFFFIFFKLKRSRPAPAHAATPSDSSREEPKTGN